MADAGKLRHHRDDKPQKNPPPQHDARIMEQVQHTPQSIAEEPKPDIMVTSKTQDWLNGQSGAIGLTPVVSADLDSNVVQPSANGSAHPHVKPQRLHGGDEHVTEHRR